MCSENFKFHAQQISMISVESRPAGPRAEEYTYCASPGPAAYSPRGFANPARHPAAPSPTMIGRPASPPATDSGPGFIYDVATHPGRAAYAMRCARGRSSPAAVFGRGARVLLAGTTISAGRQGLVFNDLRTTPHRDWQ